MEKCENSILKEKCEKSPSYKVWYCSAKTVRKP
jgi:hypothetical protein